MSENEISLALQNNKLLLHLARYICEVWESDWSESPTITFRTNHRGEHFVDAGNTLYGPFNSREETAVNFVLRGNLDADG